jgi:predicted ABC-type transport system involved in lysophospholipase L1 biosynthesis ATPase subunit
VGSPLAELRGVAKSFPAPRGAGEATVLRDVDLVVEAGTGTAIVGPSGSGKSTLLAILAGLEAPSAGTVTWEGRDLATLDEVARARFRNNELGFLFQAHHLLPQLSALENALVPTLARAAAADRARREERARALLARVGLGERLEHRPSELSGGERARTALVRALVNEPRMLLADEPTGALDSTSSDELATLLDELRASEGVALVVVTHSEALAARTGRVLELVEGRLVPRA